MRRLLLPISAAALMLASLPAAADPARDAILSDLAAQARAADPGFTGFSAARGETLYRSVHASGDPQANACASCHGNDPRRAGENVKTGKPIEPMAVSQNPRRYTDKNEVEKWFRRNCREVFGRECTPQEKGDFITFMIGQ
jgi:Domain of unknown function (DUF1924)